jgi:hypothetical protein
MSHGALQDLARELESSSLIGKWITLQSPSVNDLIHVKEPFLSLNDVQINLEQNWLGRVITVDREGDVQAMFPVCPTAAQWIPKNKFANLRVRVDADIHHSRANDCT